MNTINYTKMLENKDENIHRCPQCGRMGKFYQYTDGKIRVHHKKEMELFYWTVTDSCCIKR